MSDRILIAEHDRGLRLALERCFSRHGYDVAVAVDGIQCVDLLRTMAPSVLVLDTNILWGGGNGVLDWLIQEQSIRPATIVVVDDSELAEIPDRFKAWIDSRIRRPHDLHDLLPFVREIERIGGQLTPVPVNLDSPSDN